jgi:hypothetical protein
MGVNIDELNVEYEGNIIKYHPDLHVRQDEPMTTMELAYICKFYECDGAKSLSFALERSESSLESIIHRCKSNKTFEHFKLAWDKSNMGEW